MRAPILALFAWLLATPALGQDAGSTDGTREVVVGVYAPQLYFADSLARSRYAEALARGLQDAIGRPVRGRAFASGGEFSGQIAAAAVDYAVVDAQWHAEHAGLPALAQGTSGGSPTRPMVLVVQGGIASPAELVGKTLAAVNVGGRDAQFAFNFLLQGQLEAGSAPELREARDVAGALSLVKLGKAAAAFSFQGTSAGLTVVSTSRPVPLPVFVRVRDAVEPDLDAAVRKAAAGLPSPHDTMNGFTGYSAGVHAGLRAALSGAAPKAAGSLVLAPATDRLPPVPEFLETGGPMSITLPPLDAVFAVPAPPSDLF